MADFEMMNLPDALAARVADAGLSTPTPIQAQAIPHALNGRDVLGLAQTGTGKTAAFGIPLIARLMEEGGKPAPKTARGLILAPTRELAKQIEKEVDKFGHTSRIKHCCVYGGAPKSGQIRQLRKGAEIVIA
ncbi:MAG: DEAD/DEAH box helicase, partial [Pseudomonadota bacterium]